MEMGQMAVQMPELFQDEVPCGNDVVLCAKEFWSSSELAQPPCTILPAGYLARLEQDGPKIAMPRNALSDRQVSEFRKTAEAVSAEPWLMHRAADYLTAWLDQSVAGRWPQPAPHGWVMEDHDQERVEGPDFSVEWKRFAPKSPAAVVVKRRATKQGKHAAFPPVGQPVLDTVFEDTVLELPADDNPLEEPVRRRGCGRGRGRGRGRGIKRPATCVTGAGCSKCRYVEKGCSRCRSEG